MMIDSEELAGYSAFLEADKSLPSHLSVPIAGFMLVARGLRFICEPRIWAPTDDLLGPTKARVYFRAWSQNRLAAIRWHDGYYFCAEKCEVFAMFQLTSESWPVLEKRFTSKWYSGAGTRASVEEAREAVRCLKDQLAAMS